MSLKFMALELLLMTELKASMVSAAAGTELSRGESLSLLEVGWHMDTAVWKMLRPPSQRSSRIDCNEPRIKGILRIPF